LLLLLCGFFLNCSGKEPAPTFNVAFLMQGTAAHELGAQGDIYVKRRGQTVREHLATEPVFDDIRVIRPGNGVQVEPGDSVFLTLSFQRVSSDPRWGLGPHNRIDAELWVDKQVKANLVLDHQTRVYDAAGRPVARFSYGISREG
jgi:hypothetical protein